MSRTKYFWAGTFIILFSAAAWSDFTFLDGGGVSRTSSAVTDGANATLGAKADAHSCSAASVVACLGQIDDDVKGAIPAGTNNIGNVGQISQYPTGATAITASATGTTGATTATLAGAVAKTTYICWSSVRANATAATTVTDTITGVITGTLSRSLWVAPAASGLGVDEMVYNPCVPASATNTGIAVVSGAPGTGGVVTVNAGGYQL